MNYVLTFLEGLLSFISPCMLPMLPVYLAYFAGNEKKGSKLRILSFIAGFTLMFMLLGAGFAGLGVLIRQYQVAVNVICGLIMIVLGLNYLEVIHLPWMQGYQGEVKVQSVFSAFIFGIVYAVNLTPCVGAFLGSALMMAVSGGDVVQGVLLLLTYSLGMGIPFILSAFLMSHLTVLFRGIKAHYRIINRISGLFLIAVGLLMAVGLLTKVMTFSASFYSEPFSAIAETAEDAGDEDLERNEADTQDRTEEVSESAQSDAAEAESEQTGSAEAESEDVQTDTAEDGAEETGSTEEAYYAPDFTVMNAYGETVKLSDYLGTPVILNAWASWCPPCKGELPYFEAAYRQYGDQIAFLMIDLCDGVRETQASAQELIDSQGYTFPVLYDTESDFAITYGVYSIPMTLVITADGELIDGSIGAISQDVLNGYVEELLQ